MHEQIFNILITVFASTGFWAFVNNAAANRRAKKSLEREALLALLHDKLYCILNHHIEEGHISAEEYENLEYLYKPYVSMGGNGTCERLKKEVDKLPIKEGEKNNE